MSESKVTGKPVTELVGELDAVLAQRLHEIDASQSRLRRLGLLLLVLVVIFAGASGATLYGLARSGYLGTGATEVRAQRFILMDRAGAVRELVARGGRLDPAGPARPRGAGSPAPRRPGRRRAGVLAAGRAGVPRIVLGLSLTRRAPSSSRTGPARLAVLGVSSDEPRRSSSRTGREHARRIGRQPAGEASFTLLDGESSPDPATNDDHAPGPDPGRTPWQRSGRIGPCRRTGRSAAGPRFGPPSAAHPSSHDTEVNPRQQCGARGRGVRTARLLRGTAGACPRKGLSRS